MYPHLSKIEMEIRFILIEDTKTVPFRSKNARGKNKICGANIFNFNLYTVSHVHLQLLITRLSGVL